MTRWYAVVDVGCTHCAEPTTVGYGPYATRDEAEAAARSRARVARSLARRRGAGWRAWRQRYAIDGQREVMVVALRPPGEVLRVTPAE